MVQWSPAPIIKVPNNPITLRGVSSSEPAVQVSHKGLGIRNHLVYKILSNRLEGKVDSSFLDQVVCKVSIMLLELKKKSYLEKILEVKRLCNKFMVYEHEIVVLVRELGCYQSPIRYITYIQPMGDLTAPDLTLKIKILLFNDKEAALEEITCEGGNSYEKEVQITNSEEALDNLMMHVLNQYCQAFKKLPKPITEDYQEWHLAGLSEMVEKSQFEYLSAHVADFTYPLFAKIALKIYESYKNEEYIK